MQRRRMAEEGVTLTQLIAEEGLPSRLGSTQAESLGIPIFAVDGMQPGVDVSDNAATLDRRSSPSPQRVAANAEHRGI